MRLVVVRLRIDADPVLAEVDAEHLVGQERLADMGAEVAHARDGAQFLARLVVMRTISGCDVLGSVTQCIRKSRSLNEGSSECPSSGQATTPASDDEPRR